MIEKEITRIVSWGEINNILAEAREDLILVRMPRSVHNHPKMKYKIQVLKEDNRIFIEVSEKQRGRMRKIDDNKKRELLDFIKEGYSLREIAEITGIPKSTIYDHVEEKMEEIKKKAKKEELRKLIYEFKELFIEKGLYKYTSIQILFTEMEIALKVEDYDKIMEIFLELREYME
ncbi:MAG TPA: helix-turn-helix domain-containing protein [Candidatus Nanopusillus sp.]|nr:helix-turn-helix domain-containing protein [Candidatus Nanopusillus sp.]